MGWADADRSAAASERLNWLAEESRSSLRRMGLLEEHWMEERIHDDARLVQLLSLALPSYPPGGSTYDTMKPASDGHPSVLRGSRVGYPDSMSHYTCALSSLCFSLQV